MVDQNGISMMPQPIRPYEPEALVEEKIGDGQQTSRVAICIATRGRAATLAETLRALRRQTHTPHQILVCYVESADVVGLPSWKLTLIKGPPGLTVQRNVLLDMANDYDIILFLDDDFLPSPRYIEATMFVLQADKDVVATTGRVISDGAKGPGIPCEIGHQLLAADNYNGPWPGPTPVKDAYGCNMAFRMSEVRRHAIRFDERLVLYGWYEDIDFTGRLGRLGRIMRIEAARGVHLGTKSGRISGKRLGYSQVINCVYLARKGSISWRFAADSVMRHLAINLLRTVSPEPWIDRRGRLIGNVLAFSDLARGRIAPERILDL